MIESKLHIADILSKHWDYLSVSTIIKYSFCLAKLQLSHDVILHLKKYFVTNSKRQNRNFPAMHNTHFLQSNICGRKNINNSKIN